LRAEIQEIFQRCHQELRPGVPLPEFLIEFYPFTSVSSNIKIRQGGLQVRLSDLLEGSPESVIEAIAHILLAKIYRKPIEPIHATRFRRYVSGHDMRAKAHLVRQVRGRKRIGPAKGLVYHLEDIFDELNHHYFHDLLARPRMTWSQVRSRRSLAHYDPAHNTIVVSRIFDQPLVPRYAIEYILYHEMLHLKHPVKLRGSRRCVHGKEFQEEEKLFPHLHQAKAFLKTL
jgi:predicted metal-dependent hydrolase